MPSKANWVNFYGVGVLTGIGFTMSLFVGNLAFIDNMSYMDGVKICLLYTSPSPRDGLLSRMPSSA